MQERLLDFLASPRYPLTQTLLIDPQSLREHTRLRESILIFERARVEVGLELLRKRCYQFIYAPAEFDRPLDSCAYLDPRRMRVARR
jgi:hypothetical protein